MPANEKRPGQGASSVVLRDVAVNSEDKIGPAAQTSQACDFHPLADMFPLLEGDEFADLVADIKANGLVEDIVLYQGMILDGRNRYRACLAAGVPPTTHDADKWIADPAAFVISVNIRRRHLNTEQKRELIIKIIAAAPEKSDRQIAKSIGVDHKTIGAARAKGEQLGSIPQLKKTIGADGKARPRGPRARRQLSLEQRKARPSSAHGEDDSVMHVRTPGACPVPRRVRFEVAPDGDIPTREEAEESYQRTLRDLGEPYDHQSPWAVHGASAPDADEPEGEGDSEEVCWRRGLLYRATNAEGEAIYEDWSQFEVDSELVAAAERAAAAWGKTAAYLRELRQARLRSDTADPLDDIPGFLDRTEAAS